MAKHFLRPVPTTTNDSIAYLGFSWLWVLILLAETAPHSLTRVLSLPGFVTLAFMGAASNTRTRAHHGAGDGLASTVFLFTLHFINLLCITPVDCRIKRGSTLKEGRLSRYRQAAFYMSCLRGTQTEHQIARIPPAPAFLEKSTRWSFVGYQMCVVLWQLLFISFVSDIMSCIPQSMRDRYFGQGAELHVFTLDRANWFARLMVTIVPTFLCAHFGIDIAYRFLSALGVLLGLTSTEAWPPLFGSIHDACTVRGFWGRTWHQNVRWPLTSCSTFITLRIFGLRRPSILERYVHLCLTFTLSGLMHAIGAFLESDNQEALGTLFFFASNAAIIMVEDAFQHLCTKLGPDSRRKSKTQPPSVSRLMLQYGYVLSWLALTGPFWNYRILREHWTRIWPAVSAPDCKPRS
ncbi:membrane bound O-acyl transferase family-domain-containing protein [Aspergillus nidulans var. acristatus]